MQYLGGKVRIAKPIANVLLTETTHDIYVEPFLGAGSVAELVVPHFVRSILADTHPDLVMMWQAALEGWDAPHEVSEEEYRALRHAAPSALRGFVGFPCSFGGKWFGGYARDPHSTRTFADTASRSLALKASRIQGAEVRLSDYRNLVFPDESVVYADPPYASTTRYLGTDGFDNGEFWRVMESWVDRGCEVFVSEYQAPKGWEPVWSGTVLSSIAGKGNDRTVREHLFTRA